MFHGNKILIADALSRSPNETTETENINSVDNLDQTPVNKHNLLRIQQASKSDVTLRMRKDTISKGRRMKNEIFILD